MFRGGDYVDNPKFYNAEAAHVKNTLDVSVSLRQAPLYAFLI